MSNTRGLLKRGDTWYIRFTEPSGKRKWEAVGPSKRSAELVLAKRKVEIKEGRYFSTPQGLKWTYQQLLDRYLEYAKIVQKPSTYDRNTVIYVRQLRAVFGEVRLKDMSPDKVNAYIEGKLASGRAPATVRHHLRLLKHSLTMAVKWNLLPSNPLRDVQLPVRVRNARLRYLTLDEIEKLLPACPPHLRRIVLAALHTGMRRSEILKLQWNQVDLPQRLVLLTDTKNDDQRGVPLTEKVVNMLKEIQAEQQRYGMTTPFVFGKLPTKKRGLDDPNVGQPYSHDSNTAWHTALRKTGIQDFRFHDLRHTTGSYLAMQGVDIRTIQEILGHKTLAMTQRYIHLTASHKLAAVGLLEHAYDNSKNGRANGSNRDGSNEVVAISVASTGNTVSASLLTH